MQTHISAEKYSQQLSLDRSNKNLQSMSPQRVLHSTEKLEKLMQLQRINNPLQRQKEESLKRILQNKKRQIDEEQEQDEQTSQGSGAYGKNRSSVQGRNAGAYYSQSQTSEPKVASSIGAKNQFAYLNQFEIKTGSGIGTLGKIINPLQASIERKTRRNK